MWLCKPMDMELRHSYAAAEVVAVSEQPENAYFSPASCFCFFFLEVSFLLANHDRFREVNGTK